MAENLGATPAVIRRLLIANRGEIACRIISTCKKLGITSLAIFVTEDSQSLHIQQADAAFCIGSIEKSAVNPHIDIEVLLKTAIEANADAVHPGYGYLSENSEFSRRVRAAGLIFVGPGPEAIAALGDKRQAKELLTKHAPKIPLIPGYSGLAQDDATLREQAEKMGYPVLIKAAAGGGGKGMRVVHDSSSFAVALHQAQSEGLRSFGSSDCLVEKYILRGKHVEIQLLSDKYGNAFTLFERECSIQRRHQKVIEEAPCPWLSPELRVSMSEAAKTIARLLSYENAGTVEFMVDVETSKFYFLEVNTRIQVEHAITEETTGTDMVALQIFVASGGNLNDVPALVDLRQSGHAIECRLCAEDPNRDFLPGSGPILNWGYDFQGKGNTRIRVETALQTGSRVSVHFDPMIAKIVVWAPTRATAKSTMLEFMSQLRCVGLKTNQLFLQACLAHPSFEEIDYTTAFIPTNIKDLLQNPHAIGAAADDTTFAVIPSLYAKLVELSRVSQTALPSVRSGFRNQKFGGLRTGIDVIVGRSSARAVAIGWTVGPSGLKSGPQTFEYILNKIESPNKDDKSTVGTTLGNITRVMNSTKVFQDLRVYAFDSCSPVHERSWTNHHVVLDLDRRKLSAYITASGGTDRQTIFCHIPALGTFMEYQCYSLLDYLATLKSAGEDAAQDQAKVYKSQMPCRVIRMVKKAGESVKHGDVLLVVESMKMEVSIVASADGIFKPSVDVNEAVDVDVVLCELE